MLSPQLRRKVFDLWTMFWSSGMTNPLTSIEQITYLLFIKRLESLDSGRQKSGKRSIYGKQRNCTLLHHPDDHIGINSSLPENANLAEYEACKGHGSCRWSYIKRGTPAPDPLDPTGKRSISPHDHLSQYVFPWLRELENTLQQTGNDDNGLKETSNRMEDAYFQLPREKTATLQKAIATIDELFQHVGDNNFSSDIMGDIFEYLLSEIETSGKNGQFRTPRHIIRFMIEILDPKPGQRIVDPASGTCGFLINTLQHILKKNTDPEIIRLEWDGAAHNAVGDRLSSEDEKLLSAKEYFSGYDNDRTMVRIGWMNMILHGVENPKVERQDALGKGSQEVPAIERNDYDLVIANPPFTGTVDKGDLHPTRFPRKSNNSAEPITNKSELLFVWLMLDLLKIGGRAAVIVPEGVLFGSTSAHIELRRQLLFEHRLEAVISLPAGVFQPYTGVKTSILVFQKIGGKLAPSEQPRTEKVWFYEISADGFTLDAKRSDKPEPNDLWDALAKWSDKIVDSIDYYQPKIFEVRWRLVDELTIKLFPNLVSEQNNTLGIHELFPELPRNPDEATVQIVAAQKPKIMELYRQIKNVNSIFTYTINEILERDEKDFPAFARKALLPLLDEARKSVQENINATTELKEEQIEAKVKPIVQEFAKLDGYNIKLRTIEVLKQANVLTETKSWSAPVRVFARRDDWQSSDGKLKGSHDETDQVRPEYLADPSIYNKFKDNANDGTLIFEYLADCIEANDFNLSAGRYKPETITKKDHELPAKIIRDLQTLETRIQDGLGKLLTMVEEVK